MVRALLAFAVGYLVVRVRRLERAAMIDPKTGLLTITAWQVLARRELGRAQRQGYPVAMLMLDVDRFKAVNQRDGHLGGDAVLRDVGRVLAGELRGYDLVARFGGDEFVALLPHIELPTAHGAADRVRRRIATSTGVTVSIGIAAACGADNELAELTRAADRALHAAKTAGRNRVAQPTRKPAGSPTGSAQAQTTSPTNPGA
jgi:diguanylate cyclase (GGDEF)-like protein